MLQQHRCRGRKVEEVCTTIVKHRNQPYTGSDELNDCCRSRNLQKVFMLLWPGSCCLLAVEVLLQSGCIMLHLLRRYIRCRGANGKRNLRTGAGVRTERKELLKRARSSRFRLQADKRSPATAGYRRTSVPEPGCLAFASRA